MIDCQLYKHNVKSLVNEDHHVIPKSWFEAAGQPIVTQMVILCPTCHSNVHWWIDQIIVAHAHGTALPPLKPMRAYMLALQGYEAAIARGLTPRRTL